jgi:hypothetical protein
LIMLMPPVHKHYGNTTKRRCFRSSSYRQHNSN